MKILLLSLALILSANVFAQNTSKTPFLRVFNLEGKKIAKGKLLQITDSTLTLKRNKKTSEVLFTDIGFIKTKRSFGHNIAIGTVIGAGTMTTISAVSEDSSSSSNYINFSGGEGAIIGTLIGAPSGAFVGAITGLFKNSETFDIQGDQLKWNAFKALFSN